MGAPFITIGSGPTTCTKVTANVVDILDCWGIGLRVFVAIVTIVGYVGVPKNHPTTQ